MRTIHSFLSVRWRLAATVGLLATALVVGAMLVRAEPVPRTFAYQGVLTDAVGNPVNGPRSITVRVYADDTTPTALCTESEAVTVTNGLFRVVIGDAGCTVDPSWFTRTTPVHLGITVDAETLSPRLPLYPVASAYQAEHAESARRLVVRYGAEEISVGGIYCGSTIPTTADAGGYPGVKALCEAVCGDPAAHLCSAEEVGRSLQLGMSLPRDEWYSSVVGSSSANDCQGWRSNAAAGPLLLYAALSPPDPTTAMPSYFGCSAARPFLCCL